MTMYCGIDWAEDQHDVAIIDEIGQVVSRARVGNDAAGFSRVLAMLAETGETAEEPIPVAIETEHGLLVAALRGTDRRVYAINPLQASRYRSRHQPSGAKSDATDAVLLADILRTDAAAHRPLPADSNLAQAIRVLARAQQDAVWSRQQLGNQVRALLKQFYPAALEAFAELPAGTRAPSWSRPPRRAPQRGFPAHSCGRCCARPDANGASRPTWSACAAFSVASIPTSRPQSSTR